MAVLYEAVLHVLIDFSRDTTCYNASHRPDKFSRDFQVSESTSLHRVMHTEHAVTERFKDTNLSTTKQTTSGLHFASISRTYRKAIRRIA